MPVVMPNAICMHEEDCSIGWKHTDFRTGRAEVRRNRRLVDLVHLHRRQLRVRLLLEPLPGRLDRVRGEADRDHLDRRGASRARSRRTARWSRPGLYGPNHQHFFNVRMDMRVDGDRNSLFEVQTESVPTGPDNPHGNAWVQTKRQLTSELEAQRVIDPLAARSWLIASADTDQRARRRRPAYKLEPGPQRPAVLAARLAAGRPRRVRREAPVGHARSSSASATPPGSTSRRTPASTAWSATPRATARWTRRDLVVWYTAGAHHVVRPEDWPVMPVSRVGFHLKPVGFFDGNPMLDLPPQAVRLPRRGAARRAARAAAAGARRDRSRVHQGGLAAGTMSGPEVHGAVGRRHRPERGHGDRPALVAGSAGGGVLYAYLAATVVLLLVGWCVSQFAKRHTGAGSLYSWIGMAFGPAQRLPRRHRAWSSATPASRSARSPARRCSLVAARLGRRRRHRHGCARC